MPDNELFADLRWPSPRDGALPVPGPADEAEPAVDGDDDGDVEVVDPTVLHGVIAERATPSFPPLGTGRAPSSRPEIEANDRLAARLLDRLHVLREDLDANLAEVR